MSKKKVVIPENYVVEAKKKGRPENYVVQAKWKKVVISENSQFTLQFKNSVTNSV